MEQIRKWIAENPTIFSIVIYVLLAICVLILIQLLRRFLRKQVTDTTARYKSQKGIEIIGYIVLIFLTVSYFTGNIRDFTLAVGLFTAGIAITLQELVLSIAGSLYIFIVKVYQPGDRIEINGIKGDVIDVDSIYTTMMEIGQWVSSDNYSGRIVKLSNAFVFKGPVYNYSKDFPFIWDEFNLPFTYNSDIELAKSIVIKIASHVLSEFTALLDPTLAISLTDNWIEFNLRYIVDYKKRRATKHVLFNEIHKEVKQSNGKVALASATLELVKIPEIKIDMNNS